MQKSNLCDCSHAYNAYIVFKWSINVEGANDGDKYNINFVFKKNAPFISCILKFNNTLTDNAEDLDIVMPMYNVIEYSRNYRKTTGSL